MVAREVPTDEAAKAKEISITLFWPYLAKNQKLLDLI
jgi:hypothetical protein